MFHTQISNFFSDDVMHTSDEEKDLGEEIVFQIIRNQSAILREKFPNTPIFPALGNHDMFPDAQFPVGEDFASNPVMSMVAESWCDLFLGESECEEFSNGNQTNGFPGNSSE